jgi:FkbM family methyltransferase
MLRQWINRNINRALRGVGYELCKTVHTSLGDRHAQEALSVHLRELFPALGIDTVLDVGANLGQYYDFLRERVEFRGMIYSFEPIPELAAALGKRAKGDAKWDVLEYALGANNGTANFMVRDRSGWSSLREARPGQSNVTDAVHVTRTLSVKVLRLDDFVRKLNFKNLYVKLDTGSDMDVMRGGEETLRMAKALQTELQFIPWYEGAASASEVFDFLDERNYALTAVLPLWWADDLRMGEADAVFKRTGA